MSDKKYYALSDEVIFQIRELLQLALITGTHIVDNMRQMRLEEAVDGSLVLTEEYKQYHLNVVSGLMKEIEALKNQETDSTETTESQN